MPMLNNVTPTTRWLGIRGAAQYLIADKPQFAGRELESFVAQLNERIGLGNGPAHGGVGELRRFSYHDLDAWAETQGS